MNKFQCKPDCGKCCVSHGEYGFVYLTMKDAERLSHYLGKEITEFAENLKFDFTRFSKDEVETLVLKGDGPACQFLKGTSCGVYEARPTQCRTFPFWPENMNAKSWKALKEFCPGIDEGEPLDPEYIAKQLKDQSLSDG